MNQLKQRLQTKLDKLRSGETLFYQAEDGIYAFALLTNSDAKKIEELMVLGGPLSLLSSSHSSLAKTYELSDDSVSIPCHFKAQGLIDLGQGLSKGGDQRVVLRVVDHQDILKNESPEGRIVEFASNVELQDQVLLYTKPLQDLDVDANILLNEEDVSLSRFFNPRLLQLTGITDVDLLQGAFKLYSFYSEIDGRYHWAFVCDREDKMPLVRIESECLTGHVFGSLLCDCGDQLSKGLVEINEYGHGALVYLRQEGRGIGLKAKLEAYHLQQVHGLDTVDANIAVGMPEDARDYVIGAQILNYLKFDPLRLLTNNPAKIVGLNRYGLNVEQQVSHIIPPSEHNKKYLDTKRDRMGHQI